MILRALMILLALTLAAPACELPARLDDLRADLLVRTNAERRAQGLSLLAAEPRLTEAAQIQACRMAERDRLTHRGSWLAGLGRRLRREGYPYALAVENIGMGQESAAQIVAGWMASPSHRVNMLASGVTDAGFGIARAEGGRLHWSMIAAAPQP